MTVKYIPKHIQEFMIQILLMISYAKYYAIHGENIEIYDENNSSSKNTVGGCVKGMGNYWED